MYCALWNLRKFCWRVVLCLSLTCTVQLASGMWVTALRQLRFSFSDASATAAMAAVELSRQAVSAPAAPPPAPSSGKSAHDNDESSPRKTTAWLVMSSGDPGELSPITSSGLVAAGPLPVGQATSDEDIPTPLSIEAVPRRSPPPATAARMTVEAALATDSELESRRAKGARSPQPRRWWVEEAEEAELLVPRESNTSRPP